MNDFAFGAQVCLAHARTNDPVLETCLRLAEAPTGPLGMDSPDRLTVSLFSSPHIN